MKKKLLSTVFALAMGATCTIGFTACGGDDKNNDADTASKAVNYIKALYENKSEETPESYTVNGVSPVDGNLHTVNWSVAKGEGCELNDISAYVSVGAMNTEKQVPITIAKAEVAIPYVLTASVTVGKETKSINFNRKVPAKSAGHAGTQADPYTPSNIRDVASAMESKWDTTADQSKSQSYYYPNNETPTRVYVKGYVVSTGNQLFQDKGTYAQFIYLADTFGKGKKQDDADVIMLMSISYTTADSLIKSAADINEGDCLTVSGFIQNYFKDSNSKAQPEISRFKNADGTYQETVCVERVEAVDERTDAQKIDDALGGVPATLTVARTGETALPVSSEEDVTFTYAIKSGTAATLTADGKKLNVAALPAEDAEVVVTVTATCGTETKTKDVTVTVRSASAVAGAWQKVTSASELKAGDTIIISYGAYALGAKSSNSFYRTAVSFDATNPSESVSTITLEDAGNGKFYLKVSDGYLTAPVEAKNNLLTKEQKETDGSSEWTITIDASGNATITPTTSSEGRNLLFNSNSGQERFSCYKTANSTNKNVSIFINPLNN